MDEGDDFMAALSQALAEAEKSEAEVSAVAEAEESSEATPSEDESPAEPKQAVETPTESE
jgi:hypothetical protein